MLVTNRAFTLNRNSAWTSEYWFDLHTGEGWRERGSMTDHCALLTRTQARILKHSRVRRMGTGALYHAPSRRGEQRLLLRFVLVRTRSRPVLTDPSTLLPRPPSDCQCSTVQNEPSTIARGLAACRYSRIFLLLSCKLHRTWHWGVSEVHPVKPLLKIAKVTVIHQGTFQGNF